MASLAGWQRRYGDTFTLRLPATGRVLVTSAPALVDQMLTGPRDVYLAGEATGSLLPLLPGDSILRRDGQEHRDRRMSLLPTVSGPALQAQMPQIEQIVERHVAGWPLNRSLAVHSRAQALAFEVACHVLLGLTDADAIARLEPLVSRLAAPPVGPAVLLPRLRRPAHGRGPTAEYRRRTARLDEEISGILAAATPPNASAAAALADEPGAAAELATLLLVGQETTAAGLSWTLSLLARHPREAERLAASADPQLTAATVQEALRLRPPVFDVVRALARDVVVEDLALPAGTLLLAASLLVHRRPDHYRSPHAFEPSRFLEHRPDPMHWIPFGGGVRRCLGAALAQAQLESAVTAVLARARLRPVGDEEPARLHGTTLVPARGGQIVLERR